MGLFLQELPGVEGPAQDLFGFLGGVTCSPAGFPRRRAMAVAVKLRVRLRCFVSHANDRLQESWMVGRVPAKSNLPQPVTMSTLTSVKSSGILLLIVEPIIKLYNCIRDRLRITKPGTLAMKPLLGSHHNFLDFFPTTIIFPLGHTTLNPATARPFGSLGQLA
jgi:hypothetical protein